LAFAKACGGYSRYQNFRLIARVARRRSFSIKTYIYTCDARRKSGFKTNEIEVIL